MRRDLADARRSLFQLRAQYYHTLGVMLFNEAQLIPRVFRQMKNELAQWKKPRIAEQFYLAAALDRLKLMPHPLAKCWNSHVSQRSLQRRVTNQSIYVLHFAGPEKRPRIKRALELLERC